MRTVISSFVTALQARDVDAIISRFPGAAGEWANAWRTFYTDRRNVQDLSTRLGSISDFTTEGTTASANFTVAAQFSGTGGRQRPTFVFAATFTHDGTAWRMTGLRQIR